MPKLYVRYLRPSGHYPGVHLNYKKALYSYDSDRNVLFTAVEESEFDSQYFSSETAWALVSEIRLWASILLSKPPYLGTFSVLPSSKILTLNSSLSTISIDCLSENLVLSLIRREQGEISPTEYHKFRNDEYHLDLDYPDESVIDHIYGAIDPKDNVLMRGLSCLLKSRIYLDERQQFEEAALLCYFALEATFVLIKKRYRLESFEKVFELLENSVENGVFLADYYKVCRDNRNMLVHPDARVGSYALPPISADDYFDTYHSLVQFFRHYLTDMPWENDT